MLFRSVKSSLSPLSVSPRISSSQISYGNSGGNYSAPVSSSPLVAFTQRTNSSQVKSILRNINTSIKITPAKTGGSGAVVSPGQSSWYSPVSNWLGGWF